MAGNGAGEQRKDTGLGILVKSILGFFFVIIVVWWLHYTMVLKMLARRGASMLASYLAVNSTFDFALSMCGFIILGVTPMLSKTSGEGDDAASGKVMRQTIVISTVAGTITAVFLSVFHRELLLLFKPRDEDESLVAGASTMLLVQGVGFTFPVVCMGSSAIAVALLQIYTIAIAGAVSYALWIVVALACFHSTSLGLPSFGVGVVVSYPVYAFICDAMTRGDAAQREKYGLDRGYFEVVSLADLRAFVGAIGLVGVRSFFSTTRALLTPLAAIKLGVVEGAVYSLLLELQAPALLLALASAGINFFGARMIGAGEVAAFRLFVVHSSALLLASCALVCASYVLVGPTALVVDAAKDDERGDYRGVLSPLLWGLAVAALPLRLLSSVVDNVLLATHDFKTMGQLYVFAFLAYFAALAVAVAHVRSLAAVFLADFLFYFVRVTATAAYIRAVTFRRHPHWVTTAPVDDPRETYEAELRSLLANFGYRRFRRFVLLWTRLDPPWAVILIGIYRSMIRDLREAAVMLRRRSSLGPKPKAPVAPL